MKAKAYLFFLASLAVLAGCTPQPGERERSAVVDIRQGATFFINDAQGTPIALADASGAMVEQRAHHALGASRNDEPVGDAHDFVGNEIDADVGISDFNARPYRTDTGTFLAPDPVAVFDPGKIIGDPRRAHAYAYSAGDPVNLQDSNGEFFDVLVDVASIGYDLYSIVADNIVGNEDNLGTNLASLGADVVGAIVPFATGGGAAVRAATHGDDVLKIASHADEVVHAAGAVKRTPVGPKTAAEMADDLADQLGRNRVGDRTAGGRIDIDLRGKGHFDKASGRVIETPHVHEAQAHVGPDGKSSLGAKTTREATKNDVRLARELAKRSGQLP